MNRYKIVQIVVIFLVIFTWIFSGWPRIWQNPPIPPEIQVAWAAAAYRSSGTFTAGTGAITPPYPAGMVANDVCLLVVTSENQAISLTTANGFVEVPTWSPQSAGTAATNPGSRLAVFWKRTVGGDSAPVVADSGNNTEGRIHCFSGIITSGNPWDTGAGGNDSAANDTTGTIPGSTTTVANTLVVLIISTSYNGTSTAQFASWTNGDLTNLLERSDNSNTANLGGGHGMATGEKANAGSYTTTTVTLANTSYKGAISLALKPAIVSVTVSDGNVTYGTLNVNTSRSTLPAEENEMQTATNNGNVTVNFNIKGTVSSPGGWTLAGTAAENVYVHKFCNDTDLDCETPFTNYTALTTNYATLDTSVANAGTVDFQLRITTPTVVSSYVEQDVDVWVQAVQP